MRTHDPHQPKEQEKIEHEMTHNPFSSWCRHRIKGEGARMTVAKRSKKKDMFQKIAWIRCSG